MSGYFVYRLIPPRPTFAQDMDDHERSIMGRHVEYWQKLLSEGRVLLFGPVLDRTGSWGLGVFEAQSEDEARAIVDSDPAIKSGMARAELGPMVQAVLRP